MPLVSPETAGLVVATRLSEDSNISVLVLDAGLPNFDEPLISRAGQYGFQFGNPQFDWDFKTVPQKHVQGNRLPWNRGKSLGGSSAMNFSGWSVPLQEDINDWERLGNPGWNWKTYRKYHDKAIKYVPLEVSTRADLAFLKKVWDINNHSSPLLVTHPRVRFEIDHKIQEALGEMGIERARAPIHGDPKGVHVLLSTIDPHTHLRAYSATAYFKPASNRPNLFVLPTAYVHRIVTKEQENKEVAATGVEFSYGEDTSLQRFQNRAYLAEFCDVPGFFALDKPPMAGKKYFAFLALLNHPFSRGTIHATSNDPFANPDMDPHYWEHEIDQQALIEGIEYVRKIVQTTALRDEIEVEYTPGPEVQSDEQLAGELGTISHPIFTVSDADNTTITPEWATKVLCTTFRTLVISFSLFSKRLELEFISHAHA
ncbi:hypothetical protein PM082_006468 [Marasmius tenuissimus]|nr:hypothetical protein PM082_006468 [Marasmius tenuissimus]